MKQVTKIVMASLLVAVSIHEAMAAPFPRGCENNDFVFSRGYLMFNETGKQSLYLVQNYSRYLVEMEHYANYPDGFMSPKLETKLSPDRWAAFSSNVEKFFFMCYINNGDERVRTDCSTVLDICQYPRVKFSNSNKGNYWVSTDKSQAQVVQDATHKGIFLHW